MPCDHLLEQLSRFGLILCKAKISPEPQRLRFASRRGWYRQGELDSHCELTERFSHIVSQVNLIEAHVKIFDGFSLACEFVYHHAADWVLHTIHLINLQVLEAFKAWNLIHQDFYQLLERLRRAKQFRHHDRLEVLHCSLLLVIVDCEIKQFFIAVFMTNAILYIIQYKVALR